MASKKVAELENSEVAIFDDDSLLSGGTGLEEASANDYAIPFLRVLQSMSPQLKKSDGQYIAEAQEGNFFNSVTNKVYDGDTGVLIVPCAYKKKYIEWIPREKGGGFVSDQHDHNELAKCTKDDSGKFIMENGNQLVETAEYYSLIAEEDSAPEQVLLSLTSSQLRFSRRWNTMLNNATVNTSVGETFQAPMFAYTYRLTSIPQSNDQYSWMGLSVERAYPTSMPLAKAAMEFMKAARQGDVNVQQEQESTVSNTEEGDKDIPF